MKKLMMMTLTLSVFALTSLSAEASRHDHRQKRQKARIAQGVASGELTQHEAKRAAKQQRKINRMEKRAEADGKVTAREKYKLEKAQDAASHSIYRMKHDEDHRGQNPAGVPAVDVPVAVDPASESTSN